MNEHIMSLDDLKNLFDCIYIQIDVSDNTIKSIEDKSLFFSAITDIDEFLVLLLKQNKVDVSRKVVFYDLLKCIKKDRVFSHHTINLPNQRNDMLSFEIRGAKCKDQENDFILAIKVINNITESTELDTLTKVFLRQPGIDAVKKIIANKEKFALMIGDVDFFKEINDSFGHKIGDLALSYTAQAIRKVIEPNGGIVARIGGDEFLIAYKYDGEYENLWAGCRKIREEVSSITRFKGLESTNISITLGCASYPKDGTTYDTLFLKADKALYRGKRKGRNCFIIYSPAKCGQIGQTRVIQYENSYRRVEAAANNANLISAILEIMARNDNVKDNIIDAIDIVGNYFLLDRITLISKKTDYDTMGIEHEWTTDYEYSNKIQIDNEYINLWNQTLNGTGSYIQFNVEINNYSSKLKQMLANEQTRSILCYQISNGHDSIGHIRFDMCTHSRMWKQDDLFSMSLIAKIFAVFLAKQYTLNNQMARDEVTNLYTYSEFLKKADDYKNSLNTRQFVMSSINIINYNELDISKINEIIKEFAEILVGVLPPDSIIARVNQSQFVVMRENSLINERELIFQELLFNLEKNESLRKLVINVGVYLFGSNDDIAFAVDKANNSCKNAQASISSTINYSQEN